MDSTGLCITAGCWTELSRVLCADESVLDHRCHRSTGPLDLPGKKTQHFFFSVFFTDDTLMRKAHCADPGTNSI